VPSSLLLLENQVTPSSQLTLPPHNGLKNKKKKKKKKKRKPQRFQSIAKKQENKINY
jgi:hypothetical protein